MLALNPENMAPTIVEKRRYNKCLVVPKLIVGLTLPFSAAQFHLTPEHSTFSLGLLVNT